MDTRPFDQGGDETDAMRRRPRQSRPRRHAPWLLLLSLGAGLRLTGLASTDVWHDEAMSIHTARMGILEQVVHMSVANNQPPLFFLLLKVWAVVSWSPLWLRLMSVFLSLVGVAYAVRWLRLWDRQAGWMAGALAATSPIMIHYAQEIRAYALLHACTLAGLYFGELVARGDARRDRAALLLCTCALGYAHYVGLLVAAALWVYVLLRRAGLRRTVVPAAAWAALVAPIIWLGASHASDKAERGYWIPPVTQSRMIEFTEAWTGHAALREWGEAGPGAARSSAALALSTLLAAGVGLALVTSIARRDADQRWAVAAFAGTAAGCLAGVLFISAAIVPIALPRTTFLAVLPLVGVAGFAAATPLRPWIGKVGLAGGLIVVTVGTFVWPARVYAGPERRPPEQTLFKAVAQRLKPGDVVIVFPADLQASAGYFLGTRATSGQIHSTDQPRLVDTPDGLRLIARPRERDSAWLADLRLATREARALHPEQHGIWLVDMGPRSTGDPDRQRLLEWLKEGYVPAESFACGERWPLAAQYYVPTNTRAVNDPRVQPGELSHG